MILSSLLIRLLMKVSGYAHSSVGIIEWRLQNLKEC